MDSWVTFRQVLRDTPGPCGLYKASVPIQEERCFLLQTTFLVVGLCWEEGEWEPTRHGLLPCSYAQEGCALAHLTLSANCLNDKAVRELSR